MARLNTNFMDENNSTTKISSKTRKVANTSSTPLHTSSRVGIRKNRRGLADDSHFNIHDENPEDDDGQTPPVKLPQTLSYGYQGVMRSSSVPFDSPGAFRIPVSAPKPRILSSVDNLNTSSKRPKLGSKTEATFDTDPEPAFHTNAIPLNVHQLGTHSPYKKSSVLLQDPEQTIQSLRTRTAAAASSLFIAYLQDLRRIGIARGNLQSQLWLHAQVFGYHQYLGYSSFEDMYAKLEGNSPQTGLLHSRQMKELYQIEQNWGVDYHLHFIPSADDPAFQDAFHVSLNVFPVPPPQKFIQKLFLFSKTTTVKAFADAIIRIVKSRIQKKPRLPGHKADPLILVQDLQVYENEHEQDLKKRKKRPAVISMFDSQAHIQSINEDDQGAPETGRKHVPPAFEEDSDMWPLKQTQSDYDFDQHSATSTPRGTSGHHDLQDHDDSSHYNGMEVERIPNSPSSPLHHKSQLAPVSGTSLDGQRIVAATPPLSENEIVDMTTVSDTLTRQEIITSTNSIINRAIDGLRVDKDVNDETIMQLLKWEARDVKSVVVLDSFFFRIDDNGGYSRESTAAGFMQRYNQSWHRILAPIHSRHCENDWHWSLVCIDFDSPRIRHYDSLKTPSSSLFERVTKFLCDWMIRMRPDIVPDAIESLSEECTQQRGRDCGLYTIAFGIAILRNEPIPTILDENANFNLRAEYTRCLERIRTHRIQSIQTTPHSRPQSSSSAGSDGDTKSISPGLFVSSPSDKSAHTSESLTTYSRPSSTYQQNTTEPTDKSDISAIPSDTASAMLKNLVDSEMSNHQEFMLSRPLSNMIADVGISNSLKSTLNMTRARQNTVTKAYRDAIEFQKRHIKTLETAKTQWKEAARVATEVDESRIDYFTDIAKATRLITTKLNEIEHLRSVDIQVRKHGDIVAADLQRMARNINMLEQLIASAEEEVRGAEEVDKSLSELRRLSGTVDS